jgi:hypothetical protein
MNLVGSVAVAIRDFIASNLTLVIGWLVVLAATAVLNPVVGQWVRRRAEKREERLTELKRDVLQPMLAYLTDEVIPILEYRLGNIGICEARVPQLTASILESSIAIREVFCYEVVNENVASVLQRIPEELQRPAFFDSPLYRHARQHFSDLFEAWDVLLQEFGNYNAASIHYAEWLRSEFARVVPLPEYEDIQEHRRASPIRLALVALYRQVGIWTFPLSRRQDQGREVLDYGGATLIKGTLDEIPQYIAVLNELIGKRDQVDRLMTQAAPIRDRALQVKVRIEDTLAR